RLDRFADRKLSLAVDLVLAADLHTDQARQQVAAKFERWEVSVEYGSGLTDQDGEPYEGPDIPSIGPSQPVRSAFLALELVSPGMTDAAKEFYLATVNVGRLAAGWQSPERDRDRQSDREWADADEKWT